MEGENNFAFGSLEKLAEYGMIVCKKAELWGRDVSGYSKGTCPSGFQMRDLY